MFHFISVTCSQINVLLSFASTSHYSSQHWYFGCFKLCACIASEVYHKTIHHHLHTLFVITITLRQLVFVLVILCINASTPLPFFCSKIFFWYWREGCHLHAGIRAVDHPATWCLCHTSCMQFFFSFSIVFLLKPVEFALIGCIFLVVAFLVYWACCSWTTFFPYLLSSWKKALVFFQLLLTVYRNHTSRFQVST